MEALIEKSKAQHISKYLKIAAEFYNKQAGESSLLGKSYRRLLAGYYKHLIPAGSSILEIGCASGELLCQLTGVKKVGIDISDNQIQRAKANCPQDEFYVCPAECLDSFEGLKGERFDVIVISDTLNYAADVQKLLECLHEYSHSDTRVILNVFNTLWKPILNLADFLGLRRVHSQSNWLSKDDTSNLLSLADWDLVKTQPKFLIPIEVPGLDFIFNKLLAALFEPICWSIFQVARSKRLNQSKEYSVSVIIPARNEMGNIEDAVLRTPKMGLHTEIIFIEGNSTDKTWDKIQEIQKKYSQLDIHIMRQTGKGKGNAVREAYAVAKGDIFMILDADLTVPPEELPKFYKAVASGFCDYANGVRLVYPMEKEAMRFINMCGNKFFSLAFSWVLGQNIKDTLCGTKVLKREHYLKISANRSYFGDFDPFGDFDLIFGAAKLNMKFSDIPIRYRDRTYGETNIDRWSHGWLLIKMLFFSLKRIKFV